MSRRIEKCRICKGTGLITVDDWLVKGMTEEQIAKEKEEAIADVVEVVRCKDCKHFISDICRHDFAMNLSRADDFCSYGERKV